MSREYRILALAGAFFILGVLFFFLRMQDAPAPAPQSFSPDRSPRITSRMHLPPPATYAEFAYASGTPLGVDIVCTDAYYTILIFESGTDYREKPWDAKYNVATPCAHQGEQHMTLSGIPLTEGRQYYMVRAHQGSAGEWYNPY